MTALGSAEHAVFGEQTGDINIELSGEVVRRKLTPDPHRKLRCRPLPQRRVLIHQRGHGLEQGIGRILPQLGLRLGEVEGTALIPEQQLEPQTC